MLSRPKAATSAPTNAARAPIAARTQVFTMVSLLLSPKVAPIRQGDWEWHRSSAGGSRAVMSVYGVGG